MSRVTDEAEALCCYLPAIVRDGGITERERLTLQADSGGMKAGRSGVGSTTPALDIGRCKGASTMPVEANISPQGDSAIRQLEWSRRSAVIVDAALGLMACGLTDRQAARRLRIPVNTLRALIFMDKEGIE